MVKFKERFNELIDKDFKSVAKYLKVNYLSSIYDWANGISLPRFETIIKLANYFKCSLDYLLGRSEEVDDITNNSLPNFNKHFKFVLTQCNKKPSDFLKDNILSRGHLFTISKNKYLSAENMVKIADYLKISLDFLVGRV